MFFLDLFIIFIGIHLLVFGWYVSTELENLSTFYSFTPPARKRLKIIVSGFFWELGLLWFIISSLYKFTIDVIQDK